MGSMISIGETFNCDCSNYGKFSSFTVSDVALNKITNPVLTDASNPVVQTILTEILISTQADNYVKQMRDIQHEHSKKCGLTLEQIECLINSVAEHFQSLTEIAPEYEKQLADCIKQEGNLITCEEPVNIYLKTIEDQAKRIAHKNSKDDKVDTSVFSQNALPTK